MTIWVMQSREILTDIEYRKPLMSKTIFIESRKSIRVCLAVNTPVVTSAKMEGGEGSEEERKNY